MRFPDSRTLAVLALSYAIAGCAHAPTGAERVGLHTACERDCDCRSGAVCMQRKDGNRLTCELPCSDENPCPLSFTCVAGTAPGWQNVCIGTDEALPKEASAPRAADQIRLRSASR